MKVIIPVAGVGSRLRPHTFTQPKALLPVAGKPIIGHIVESAIAWGGDKFVFIIGHYGEQIEQYLRKSYKIDMEFRRQDVALGLGHAVYLGLDPGDEDLLIILGDTIVDADLKSLITAGRTFIGVKEVQDPRRFGVVELENNRVKRLVEKPSMPPSNLALVGVYFIRDGIQLKSAIEEVMRQGKTVKNEYQLTDALQVLIDWNEDIGIVPIEGWFDCGKVETVLETNRFLFNKLGSVNKAEMVTDSIIVPPVCISHKVHIVRSVIGPYVVLGEGVRVHNSVIRDSLIDEETHIENAILADSLIGNRVHIKGTVRHLNLGSSSEVEL